MTLRRVRVSLIVEYSLLLNASLPVSPSTLKSTALAFPLPPFLGLELVTVSIGNFGAPAVRDIPAYPSHNFNPTHPTTKWNTHPRLEPSRLQPTAPNPRSNVRTPYELVYQPVRTILRLFPQAQVDPSESSGFGVDGNG
jgi:hypothetical protein